SPDRHARLPRNPASGADSFFFSSRRRHTRFSRDWSSDVCSSDLTVSSERRGLTVNDAPEDKLEATPAPARRPRLRGWLSRQSRQIGRASCRERAEIAVAADSGARTRSGHETRTYTRQRLAEQGAP